MRRSRCASWICGGAAGRHSDMKMGRSNSGAAGFGLSAGVRFTPDVDRRRMRSEAGCFGGDMLVMYRFVLQLRMNCRQSFRLACNGSNAARNMSETTGQSELLLD